MSDDPVMRFVDKLVELDKKYNFTDMILGFLLGFGVALMLVFSNPGMFEVRTHPAEYRYDNSLDNLFKENIGEVNSSWEKSPMSRKSSEPILEMTLPGRF